MEAGNALDPDPISGGRIIVQVKRYRNTVPPSAVRDLYGTVQDPVANKGLLVTTSGFGSGSCAFANGKPLQLVTGPELVELLGGYGLRGRLGRRARRRRSGRAARPTPPSTRRRPGLEHARACPGSGDVALDVCALVCRGHAGAQRRPLRVLQQPRHPDGSVRDPRGLRACRAAIRVAFDGLPPGADRLVLVAALDPSAGPSSDLSGFTEAGDPPARRRRAPTWTASPSPDGRPGETALVLGSFRRRDGGDWDFVVGGKGYRGGLAALVEDFGIEVE